MSLPHGEWLHIAKGLAIGGSTRVKHLSERRPNMIVKNLEDRYVVYCQACKEGGVVMKEHVRLTGIAAPSTSCDLSLPLDMVEAQTAPKAVQDGVYGFIASKNMDATYLPNLWFSKSRCRVLLSHLGEWLGRDTTGRSPQKWITYNRSNHLGPADPRHDAAVVVEDPFSFFKVRWAVYQADLRVDVYTSLGTAISDDLTLKLISHHTQATIMYDGDSAGYKGMAVESRRLRSLGILSPVGHCAPKGFDPKDMGIAEIQSAVLAMTQDVI